MKEDHRRKHSHHITQTDHRIRHAEREVLDDIHPKDGADGKKDSTADKLPVDEQPTEISP